MQNVGVDWMDGWIPLRLLPAVLITRCSYNTCKKTAFYVAQAERKMLLRDLMIVVAVVERRKGNLKPNADSLVRIEL